ncbi:hypothetical protein K7432_014626 [Basidiobolus ranarum]|uniref:C2H2-type domain-containing protein n=1 Tax=Basidiobolus ranarum TaxID=34480 RepID=A0ABR2VP80_9FUNG
MLFEDLTATSNTWDYLAMFHKNTVEHTYLASNCPLSEPSLSEYEVNSLILSLFTASTIPPTEVSHPNDPLVTVQRTPKFEFVNCDSTNIDDHVLTTTRRMKRGFSVQPVMTRSMFEASDSVPTHKRSRSNTHMDNRKETHVMEKPYKCTNCSKAFARKYDLDRHSRLHTGEKPYKCAFCNMRFARVDARKRHYRINDCQSSQPDAPTIFIQI